jgi:cell shape-determining protein MreD
VVLVVCLAGLSLSSTGALWVGFLAGALVDLSIASSVLGLRALVYTVVAYLAVRTRARAESGVFATGVWIALLTLVSVVLLLVVGITFGQSGELGSRIGSRLVQVPASNFLIGTLLAVPLARLLQRARGVTV